ncbi:MAG: hydrogenase nickel incorporation protein HypB [Verrucomicrobia bacterium]|nr:hydrogenase nickel incorporation protein HypB [Verrucomicrobiota bacterium]
MCKECGCGIVGEVNIAGKPSRQVPSPLVNGGSSHAHSHVEPHDHPHPHSHDHDHGHPHEHPHAPATQTLEVHQAILAKNDRQAERNRGFFKAKGLLVLNVVSSPGSGKTTLIQKTISMLAGRLRAGVIVGDLATDNDAARLRSAGCPVVQITTGTVCHLEADMVARAAGQLDLGALDLLVIENVGNLVCPATYDLGEDLRVVLLAVTEGEDKPLKYPPMFHSAEVALLNKMDLAAATEFDRATALENLRRASPHATIFEVSGRTGQGLGAWCDFLVEKHRTQKA